LLPHRESFVSVKIFFSDFFANVFRMFKNVGKNTFLEMCVCVCVCVCVCARVRVRVRVRVYNVQAVDFKRKKAARRVDDKYRKNKIKRNFNSNIKKQNNQNIT